MKDKMRKKDIREVVTRVIDGKETIEAVVKDLKKDKDITVPKLNNWVKERTGIMTARDKNKAVSCVLNNKENIEEVTKRFDVPKETLDNWIKKNKKNREMENLKIYHEGIRRDDYKGNIYTRFKMDIGVKFSTIRFMEIMYRDFCENNADIFDDIEKVDKIGRKYKINLNHVDRETAYNQISLDYLTIIHECFDNYLNNLFALLKEGSKKQVRGKKDKEIIFDCILDNMDYNSEKNSDYYKICNYYRLVRNAYIHDSKVEDAPQIEVTLPNKEVVKPNIFPKICFKDADLFTYVALEMSKKLYDLLDLDVEKIIENRDLYNKLELAKYGQERRGKKLVSHLAIVLPNNSVKLHKDVQDYINKKQK